MEEKNRNYIITINPNAECYDNFSETLEGYKGVKYAYILHDKDVNEDETPKLAHYHVVVSFTNARGFIAISNQFKGAHIEKASTLTGSIRYLLHKDHQSKHQYNDTDIITNNELWLKEHLLKEAFPVLSESVVIGDLVDLRRANRLYMAHMHFYITYGNEQTKKFRQMIEDLSRNLEALDHYIKCIDNQDYDLPF